MKTIIVGIKKKKKKNFSGVKEIVNQTHLKSELLKYIFEDVTEYAEREEMENMAEKLRGSVELKRFLKG